MIRKHKQSCRQGGIRNLPRGRDRHRLVRGGVHAAGARRHGADDHRRDEELPRGVHPRPALQAGARGEGLHRLLQGEHRLDRAHQTSLTSGKINFYPEYTGVIVQDVFHKTTRRRRRSATYALAKQLEAAKGYTLLNATPFYDTDVVAVTNATAKKYGLKSIGDLKKVGSFKFGGFPECKTRNTCFVGYTKQYGLTKRRSCRSPASRRTRRSTPARSWRRTSSRPTRRSASRSKYTVLDRPEARDGLPERRADRQDVGGHGARPEVHDHGQRRLGEADAARDRRDEQGVLVDKQSPRMSPRRS